MPAREEIKRAVRETDGAMAEQRASLDVVSCCEPSGESKIEKLLRYGYSSAELERIPESVKVMSDGCGNPTGLGMIKEGKRSLTWGQAVGLTSSLQAER